MTQQYDGDAATPVTVLEVSPCVVTSIRTTARDGYAAVQLGTGTRRRLTKPVAGHVRDAGNIRWFREFRMPSDVVDAAVGDRKDANVFAVGDQIQATAISKGKGFQGVMKRHHFHGQDATHGTKHAHREPGSIGGGGRNGKGRVVKGMRMAGRMGGDRVTVQGLRVVAVDATAGTIAIGGAIPGPRGGLVMLETWHGSWK